MKNIRILMKYCSLKVEIMIWDMKSIAKYFINSDLNIGLALEHFMLLLARGLCFSVELMENVEDIASSNDSGWKH